ncbi:hypothetical protein [Thermoactinomyces mirandus]|uniref:hypothetical protein n=1 Tax=Thermoactinomyces mirandus TaxID=2756294 RepID=UPI0015EF2E55|nr:hypothetical protein [Thermoactinomyces mirandus]
MPGQAHILLQTLLNLKLLREKGEKSIGRKKRSSGNPKKRRPPRPKYTSRANIFDHEVLAPLTKKFRQALKSKKYEEAQMLYKEIVEARKQHRLWLDRHEWVKIR